MKRSFFHLWLIMFLAGWILYAGLTILVGIAHGRDIDFAEKIINGFVFLAIFMSFHILGAYYTIFPRIKYLENNDNEKPPFKMVCSSVIDVSQGIDFNRLKNEIAGKWLIIFSDDTNHVLKFRERVSFWKNITAVWLKYDSNAGKLYVDCFPMTVAQNNAIAWKMLKEIEELLQKPNES